MARALVQDCKGIVGSRVRPVHCGLPEGQAQALGDVQPSPVALGEPPAYTTHHRTLPSRGLDRQIAPSGPQS